MGKKKTKIPEKFQIWIDVRKRDHLSDAHIQMARELGMNPRKFGKISNQRQEPWKVPLPEFIEACYQQRFGRSKPVHVTSIEHMVKDYRVKQEERHTRKQQRKQGEPLASRAISEAGR